MILPGCAYGCPPDGCGRDDARVPARPGLFDASSSADAASDDAGDAGPSDSGTNADAQETGSTDASADGI